jgi:hypothetical protein
MADEGDVLIRLAPSARWRIVKVRQHWGWRPGLPVLVLKLPDGFRFTAVRPEGSEIVEFTSQGVRLGVLAGEADFFRGSVLSSYREALFGMERWWLENPNDPGVSGCSHPLGASCCPAKFRRLHPELFGWRGLAARLLGGLSADDRDQVLARTSAFLRWGDGRAAVVLGTSPLVVAAYDDEMDAAFLLRFPRSLVREYVLEEGMRLVTANLHYRADHGRIAPDITPGPNFRRRYTNVRPLVADFLAAEGDRLGARRRAIAEREYRRCEELGRRALRRGQPTRSGRPLEAAIPGRR